MAIFLFHLVLCSSQKKVVVDSYLGVVVHKGVLLCLIALFLWYLSISEDFHNIADFLEAVTKAKRAHKTVIELTSEGKLRIVSFNIFRVIWVRVLCATRMAILVCLAWVGTYFIVNTETIVDLIINALALQAVLSVDSLMFKAIVPLDAAKVAEKLEFPLKRKHFLGLDVRSFLVLLAVPSALTIAYLVLISPRLERMEQARDVLCRGQTNFLIAMDGLGIPHASMQNSSEDLVTSEYQMRAVQKAIDGAKERDPNSMLIWVPSKAELENLYRSSIVEAVAMHQSDLCMDMLDRNTLVPKYVNFRVLLSGLLPKNDVHPLTSCRQVAHLCWNLSAGNLSQLARLACPSTCGCTDPRGGVLYNVEASYCAPSCRATGEFSRKHAQVECMDMPPAQLRQEVWWTRNAQRMQWMQTQTQNASPIAIQQVLLDFGCVTVQLAKDPLVASVVGTGFDLCDDFSLQARTFWRSACPEACNCTRSFREGCPPKCQKLR